MTQITPRVSHRRGANRLMEPKAITNPRGIAPSRVTEKSLRVWIKPSLRAPTTVRNMGSPPFSR